MPATQAERFALRRGCTLVVPDFASRSAAEDFREIADGCEAGLFARLREAIAARRKDR